MRASDVDFVPVTDVLLRDPELPYRCVLHVLGIATRFESNSSDAMAVVEDAFGAWREAGEPHPRIEDCAHVRIVVHEGCEHADRSGGRVPVRHICPDPIRLVAHSPGSVAVSDPARREVVAYTTTELVACRETFRSSIVEGMTLALLSHFDRHPLHAAAVGRGGRAILLAAPSGTGKSTLAYVAQRAGLDVISEDHVWIQREPQLRVWGWPGRVRLSADAIAHFPELARSGSPSFSNGKEKLAIDVGGTRSTIPRSAHSAVICLLERAQDPVSLSRIGAKELTDELLRQMAPGFDRFPGRQRETMAALSAGGGWRLRLSSDPHEALPYLLRMLRDASDSLSPPAPRASSASPT